MKRKVYQGVEFKIDRPKGTVKTWDLPDGGKKVFVYPVDYGFFPGLLGEDDEGLDAFVGDDPNGHLEVFQKLKRDDEGRDVLDETKFLVGVTDRQREQIYALYGPEVWARRVFHDVKELEKAARKFKKEKKARYKQAALAGMEQETSPRKGLGAHGAYRHEAIQRGFKDADARVAPSGTENTFGTFYAEGTAQ